jgi:hypothetical protein
VYGGLCRELPQFLAPKPRSRVGIGSAGDGDRDRIMNCPDDHVALFRGMEETSERMSLQAQR